MRRSTLIILFLGLLPGQDALNAQGGDALEEARKGDRAYDAGEHEKALEHYENAEERGMDDPRLRFNKGDALYQAEKYADAARAFRGLASGSEDPSLRAKAYHNLGNSHLKAGRLNKSIEAYKEALRLRPGDDDTRYNLALARKLKKRNKKKNKNDKKKKQDQKENKKENKGKNKQGDKKKKQGEKDRQKGSNSGDQKKQNQEDQRGGKGEKERNEKKGKEQKAGEKGQKKKGEKKRRALSPEEVKRLLKAMETNEAKVQRKLLRKKKKQKEGEKKDVEKDW